MANWEHQLISRIARGNGELHRVLHFGITEDDFLTSEGRSLFRNILGYYYAPDSRGSVMGEETLRSYFPTMRLVDDPSMTTEALCNEVRRQRCRIDLKAHIEQTLQLLELDPFEAAGRIVNAGKDIMNLGLSKNADIHFHDAFRRSVDKAKMIAMGYDFSVARWPWQPLQYATMGLQYDDYAVIYGRPKNFKSWLLAAVGGELNEQEKRLVIYTKEMTPDNIFQRIGCVMAGVDYDRFRHATLTEAEWYAVQGTVRLLEMRSKQQTFVCLNGQDAPKGGDTPEWLEAKIEKYNPHAVLIDGLYLMSDSKGAKKKNERVANISNDLRQVGLSRKVPIIATLQANREAAKNTEANLDEIGFSDAIGQDATLLMRSINEHKSGRQTIAVIVGGSRECRIEGFRIWAVPAANFNDFIPGGQELTSKEVEQARVDDVAEDEKNGKKKKKDQPVPVSAALANVVRQTNVELNRIA